MKVLTAAQMREVDRRTIELGIPGIILMETAARHVTEFLRRRFSPLESHRVVILCGKGNNGGDGLAAARQLYVYAPPARLDVVLATEPEDLRGEAAENYRMLRACGCPVNRSIEAPMREATIVLDALLGTGLKGAATGVSAGLIREINGGFPQAKIVAVDIPSGVDSDTGAIPGDAVRADHTITFTAPKAGQVLPPACDLVGELHVRPIGSPAALYEDDNSILLSVVQPSMFRKLLGPRPGETHKGDVGHVLVIGGSRGKTGAAAMAGMAALRAGAGLVTVASAASALPVIAGHAAELMTQALAETSDGSIAASSLEQERLAALISGKDVLAIGPGLGSHPETVAAVRGMARSARQQMVIDADGLNALAGVEFGGPNLVLTPHPGEMARLTGKRTSEVQGARVETAREFATARRVTVVLKGQRTLIAFPDGNVWINPTGTPAMATGGSGDILTGLIAGLMAQHPKDTEAAVAAAVYLHGLAGEIGARALGEQALIATDLLKYLPEAADGCASDPYTL
jgi:NAD(P)H-hydrate epimerase